MPQATLLHTDLPLPNKREGKVRDVYDCTTTDGRDALLLVATDRISAFDVVMPTPIPGKGELLTAISKFWFDLIGQHYRDTLPHHLISTDPADVADISDADRTALAGRVMIGCRTKVIPIECVVRGYLAGSGWKEYQRSGTVCDVSLPAGLRQCDKLPAPIFTPSTKAAEGHDENIDFARAAAIAGEEIMAKLHAMSLRLYELAHDHVAARGIILADTKFEFGIPLDENPGEPILIDEALTPDSSRFWPTDQYAPGRDQPSFDKQFVRNYLQAEVDAGRWDKTPPGPSLPDDIAHQTADRYREALDKLTSASPKT